MAILVLYAQPSHIPGDPHSYEEGDTVDVLEDEQHPGNKAILSPKLAFIKVPGTRAEWLHLKEEEWSIAFVPGPDLKTQPYALLNRRKRMIKILEDETTKINALDWAKTPTLTKAAIDAATIDKSI